MTALISSGTRAPVLAACRWLVMAGAFSAVANLLLLAVPLYSFQVLDRVLSSGHLDTLIWLTVIAGFAVAVLGWLDALRAGLLVQLGAALWDHSRVVRDPSGPKMAGTAALS